MDFSNWKFDLAHIPFTDYIVPWKLFWIPVLGIYYIAFVVFGIYLVFMYFYSKRVYGRYLYTKTGYILIGWKFDNGKTRLLAQFAQDTHLVPHTFIISNFFNAYSFLSWSSFDDFCNILDDLLLLWEYQNFNMQEAEKIEQKFPNYFSEGERKMLKKFKHIPYGGIHCNFILQGDEFHQYLYSRNSISNFSGEKGDRLLQTMHQVRHYNTLCMLATQDLDDLDLKLRRLASYEIDTLNYFWLFFGYNFFRYELNKRQTQKEDDKRQYRKINRFPILFFNSYSLNFVIDDIEKIVNRLRIYVWWKINKRFWKNVLYKKFVLQRLKSLDFESKFNVKLQKDIYNKGDLFIKLNDFYKKNWQDKKVW